MLQGPMSRGRSDLNEVLRRGCWKESVGGLQMLELHDQMILMGYTGHPLLSPYTVSHLYRHRVARRELDTLDTKIKSLTTKHRATDALAKKLKLKHGV